MSCVFWGQRQGAARVAARTRLFVPLASVLLAYVSVCVCARAGGHETGGVRDEIGASLVKVCEVKRAQRDDNRTP